MRGLGTERREDADPPIAEFVGESFHDHGAVVGYRTGCLGLLGEVRDEVACREFVECRVLTEVRDRVVGTRGAQSRGEGPDGPPEFDGAARLIAVPERHPTLFAGRGQHDHAIVGDLIDAPRTRTQDERLAGPALVDHLLVEFADARAFGQEHAEEAAVGNGATVGDRDSSRAVAGADRAGDAVPHDARAETGELIRRIPTGEEIQYRGERVVRRIGEGRGAADQRWRRSSTFHSSTAHMATMCWARTSSGLRTMRVDSIRPDCIRSTTTATSRRSPRYFGKIRPVLGSPT